MIEVTPNLTIRADEYAERMVKASGPGGQHVNKTSNAVELRYDVRGSGLADDVKVRLERLAGSRMTQEGVLILFSQGSRSLEMNRQEVRERLADLIRKALHRPKARRPTKPTFSSRLKRLETKTKRSGVKELRGRIRGDD
jgi:ribosome-associated protein